MLTLIVTVLNRHSSSPYGFGAEGGLFFGVAGF